MQTRIKVITRNNGIKEYITQKRFDFQEFHLIVPVIGWLMAINELFWDNLKIYGDNQFYSLEEAKKSIDEYIKNKKELKEIKKNSKIKETNYIKYP